MQKRTGKEGIKGVPLFVPLVLELFMAQIFVPLVVTRAQLELELEGNETAVDRSGNLTSLVNTSENAAAKAMDEDPGISISYDVGSSEFKANIIYGMVRNYLHEMTYANMPYGLRIFATPIPDESTGALVLGMHGDGHIQDIRRVNASCDSHTVEEYNKTEAYRLLYRMLVDGVNITVARNEILGNSSADVSANREIAKEHYQNIITSSPDEIKSLLDALMILQAA